MRNCASDIFCLNDANSDGKQIFSISGAPSFKINRRHEASNVFPSGCMGNKKDDVVPTDEAIPVSGDDKKELVDHPVQPVVEAVAKPEMEPVEELAVKQEKKPSIEPAVESEAKSATKETADEVSCDLNIPQIRARRNPLTGEGMSPDVPLRTRRETGRRDAVWPW